MNPKYIPPSLSSQDRKKQIRSIKNKTKRPYLKSFRSSKSKWVKDFENKYKTKITDDEFIHKNLITSKGIQKILQKGMAAYYNSGSRPNQTPQSWARARLASVLMKGPAFKIDEKIARMHGRRKWLNN